MHGGREPRYFPSFQRIWTTEQLELRDQVSSGGQTCCCSKVRIPSTSPSSRFSWEWISHSGGSSGYCSTYVNFSVASTASRKNNRQFSLSQRYQLTSYQYFQTFWHHWQKPLLKRFSNTALCGIINTQQTHISFTHFLHLPLHLMLQWWWSWWAPLKELQRQSISNIIRFKWVCLKCPQVTSDSWQQCAWNTAQCSCLIIHSRHMQMLYNQLSQLKHRLSTNSFYMIFFTMARKHLL